MIRFAMAGRYSGIVAVCVANRIPCVIPANTALGHTCVANFGGMAVAEISRMVNSGNRRRHPNCAGGFRLAGESCRRSGDARRQASLRRSATRRSVVGAGGTRLGLAGTFYERCSGTRQSSDEPSRIGSLDCPVGSLATSATKWVCASLIRPGWLALRVELAIEEFRVVRIYRRLRGGGIDGLAQFTRYLPGRAQSRMSMGFCR